MKSKTTSFFIVIISVFALAVGCDNDLERKQQIAEIGKNRDELLQKWYLKFNPNRDPNGPQISQKYFNNIIIAASEGKTDLPIVEEDKDNIQSQKMSSSPVANKHLTHQKYSKAELFFKGEKEINIPITQNIFKSEKYGYQIMIPEDFQSVKPRGPHIDFKFAIDDYCLIIANVSKRLPIDLPLDEVFIDQHSEQLKLMDPNHELLKSSLIIRDDNKIIVSINIDKLGDVLMKSIEYYFYKDDNLYIITAYVPNEKFDQYEDIYLKTLSTLKFN